MPLTLDSLRTFANEVDGEDGEDLRRLVEHAVVDGAEVLDAAVLESVVKGTRLEVYLLQWLNAEAGGFLSRILDTPPEEGVAFDLMERIAPNDDMDDDFCALNAWLIEQKPSMEQLARMSAMLPDKAGLEVAKAVFEMVLCEQ